MDRRVTAEARSLVDLLSIEQHGRLDGRERLASIVFPNGSIASVPPELSVSVWRGMRDQS
jgi:hypothetical protein